MTTTMSKKPNPPRYNGIRIDRHRGSKGEGFLCVICGDPSEQAPPEMVEFTLGADEYGFYLCPLHEAVLLTVLLRNWLRRVDRGKCPPVIRKETEDDPLEAKMVAEIEAAILARE